MPNLYLSSIGVIDPERFKSMFETDSIKLGVIANAKDYHQEYLRHKKVSDVLELFTAINVEAKEVDLRIFDEPMLLAEHLKSFDGIWMTGGNTFLLRQRIEDSGLRKIIEKNTSDSFVIAGESAGAVVMGLNIAHVADFDDPREATVRIDKGLGFIDRLVLPHADFAPVRAMIKKNPNVNYLTLNDNEALICDKFGCTVYAQ